MSRERNEEEKGEEQAWELEGKKGKVSDPSEQENLQESQL